MRTNIPHKWASAARRSGAFFIGEGLGITAGLAPGLGAATGAFVEAGVSRAAEVAIERMRRYQGPTVDARRIRAPAMLHSRFEGLDAWHYDAEIFGAYEREGLARVQALLDTGHIREAEALADTLHIVDASDAGNYRFVRKGYNLPESAWEGDRLALVPHVSRFDQAWEGLTRVKLRGVPLYSFVSRDEPRVRYRRLITDVSQHFGGVHLAIAAIREPV